MNMWRGSGGHMLPLPAQAKLFASQGSWMSEMAWLVLSAVLLELMKGEHGNG